MRLLLAAVLIFFPAMAGAAERAARPNIVVIMFDDMSPRIGAFGDAIARTPNLDAFARDAIRFPNSFTTAPVCAPSRAALFAGRYQQSIGAQHMRTSGQAGLPGGGPMEYLAVPPAEVKWFPELLRRAGYFTINVGKTDYQIGEPFTIWDVNAPNADWRKRPKDKPFFAFINLHRTHESYLWPETLEADNPLVRRVVARNRADLAEKPRLTDPARVRVPAYLPDTPVVRADIARLYDNIAFDEREVGRIMDALRADGVLENTVVIVTSDHGDGLPRVKRSIHDAGIRVPLMLRLPGARGGGTEDRRLVSFVDLAPTILRLAGVNRPRWVQGRPIFDKPRRFAFAAADRFDAQPERQRSASDGRYQYILNDRAALPLLRPLAFRDVMPTMQELWRLKAAGVLSPAAAQAFAPRPAEELYDLAADPDTVRNLADDPAHRRTLERLRGVVRQWQADIGDSDMPEAEMIATMWPTMVQPVTLPPTINTDRRGRLVMAAQTRGSSIGFRVGDGPWQLYRNPVVAGGAPVEAKAIRYGYRESVAVRYGG
jgi:N-sulfoglucosamine sulfohydrolase